MDWTKQANDMLKTFTSTQQKVWESWVSSVQTSTTTPSTEAWQKTVDTWRGTVRYALEQQLELTRLWAESVAVSSVNVPNLGVIPGMPALPGVPATAVEWTRQLLDVTRTMTDTQVRFSENWFEMLKKAEPSTLALNWDPTQAQKILSVWQDAAQRAVEAQNQLSQMVVKVASGTVETKR
ncbi:MAG: hypothetical protein WCP31_12070 [Chloroflexales bacterium]